MTRQGWFHRALRVPFLVALLGAIAFVVAPTRFGHGVMVLWLFHVVWGVPWFFIALALHWLTRNWSGARLARAATTVPLIAAPVAGLATATI